MSGVPRAYGKNDTTGIRAVASCASLCVLPLVKCALLACLLVGGAAQCSKYSLQGRLIYPARRETN